MSLLRVDSFGLQRLAADCEAWSAEVAVTNAPAVLDQSVQSTAAAVNTIHANVRSAGNTLSARMRHTATTLADLACGYGAQDGDAAVTLGGPAIGR